MDKTHSGDGTTIAFDRLGAGAPSSCPIGASTARSIHGQLAELLAADFTVFNYDRRGRGDSGDTLPVFGPAGPGTSRPCSPRPEGRRRSSGTPRARSWPCTRRRPACR